MMIQIQRISEYLLLVFCLITGGGLCSLQSTFANDCNTNTVEFNRGEVIRILRLGNFSGIINQKVILNKIGAIPIGGSCYEIFTYDYSFKPEGGIAFHSSQRLLIISNNTYIGKYDISDMPERINANVIEFRSAEDIGNKIIFDKDGPPKNIYLNGEVMYLNK